MEEKSIFDITEVCKILKTTSRTLRFYEEKGIITSTSSGLSPRRRYTQEQVTHIRNVLALRTLGLSVKMISDLLAQKSDLKAAILSRRAEIYAYVDSHLRKIDLLNDALAALEQGDDIIKESSPPSTADNGNIQIASICTDAVINGETDSLYLYFSQRLAEYLPHSVYEKIKEETLSPLGMLISRDRIEADPSFPKRIYSYVKYSKLGLKITFVFHKGKIKGLWLGYYSVKEVNL